MERLSSILIAKQAREHRKWLPERGQQVRAATLESVENALKDDGPNGPSLLSNALTSLGLFHGTRGVVALMEGRDSGWSDVAGAVECYLWCARLDIRSHYARSAAQRTARMANLRHTLTPAVVLLAYFVAVDESQREQSLWSLLQRPITDPHPRIRQWWTERHFEPFFVSLYAKARGLPAPLDLAQCKLHVYGKVLEAWEDDKALAGALQRACEYHCRRMAHTRSWTAEFNRTPLDLLPIEIFAVNSLRSAMGKTPIEVDHPLMRHIGPIGLAHPPQELMETLYRVLERHDEVRAAKLARSA
jgi:hypothetical protein